MVGMTSYQVVVVAVVVVKAPCCLNLAGMENRFVVGGLVGVESFGTYLERLKMAADGKIERVGLKGVGLCLQGKGNSY